MELLKKQIAIYQNALKEIVRTLDPKSRAVKIALTALNKAKALENEK